MGKGWVPQGTQGSPHDLKKTPQTLHCLLGHLHLEERQIGQAESNEQKKAGGGWSWAHTALL